MPWVLVCFSSSGQVGWVFATVIISKDFSDSDLIYFFNTIAIDELQANESDHNFIKK